MAMLKLLICIIAFFLRTAHSAIIQEGENTSRLDPKLVCRYVFGEDTVRRMEAKERCESIGLELAAIKTKGDLKELKMCMDKEKNANKVWLAGLYNTSAVCSEKFDQLCWYWDDASQSPFDPAIIKFVEASAEAPLTGDAMVVVPGQKLQLDYYSSSEIYNFVCDRRPSQVEPSRTQATTTKTTTTVVTTGPKFGNLSIRQSRQNLAGRYYISLDSVRAYEAKDRCKSLGGKLATIQTQYDFDSLKKRLSRELEGNWFWLGGTLSTDQDCSKIFNTSCWYWDVEEDGYDFYNSTLIQFTEAAQFEVPHAFDRMVIVPGRNLQLDYFPSSELHPFICDFKPSKNFHYYNDS